MKMPGYRSISPPLHRLETGGMRSLPFLLAEGPKKLSRGISETGSPRNKGNHARRGELKRSGHYRQVAEVGGSWPGLRPGAKDDAKKKRGDTGRPKGPALLFLLQPSGHRNSTAFGRNRPAFTR